MSRGIRVEYFSSTWMMIEVIGSIGIGLATRSLALLAFGGDSLVELISGLAVLTYLRENVGSREIRSSKRTEQVTSGLLSALIPVIGLGSVYSYLSGVKAESSPFGIFLSAAALVVMPYLWWEKRKIGSETRSLALTMDAIESLTCIFMSIALLGGLLANFFLGYWWADYLATAIILAFVAREAVESYYEIREEHSSESKS